MKKIFLISVIIIITIFILSLITHKEVKTYSKFTTLEIPQNPYNFGAITNRDSINHIFKIINKTNTLFIVEKALPSCPCTKATINKNKCVKNDTILVNVKFKPTKAQKGQVKTFVYLQCNAEKGVVKLEITGIIK